MKTLSDGTEVSPRSYYFLLEWNEQDKKDFMVVKFNKHRLCDLNIGEYAALFLHATTREQDILLLKQTLSVK